MSVRTRDCFPPEPRGRGLDGELGRSQIRPGGAARASSRSGTEPHALDVARALERVQRRHRPAGSPSSRRKRSRAIVTSWHGPLGVLRAASGVDARRACVELRDVAGRQSRLRQRVDSLERRRRFTAQRPADRRQRQIGIGDADREREIEARLHEALGRRRPATASPPPSVAAVPTGLQRAIAASLPAAWDRPETTTTAQDSRSSRRRPDPRARSQVG